jgi:hypothetical protein
MYMSMGYEVMHYGVIYEVWSIEHGSMEDEA